MSTSIHAAPDDAAASAPAQEAVAIGGWKRRLEDPTNTYYRYVLARPIARALVSTPITPNQVSVSQPFIAALAGYFVTFDDWRHLLVAAALFELRSVLDCVDGTLAREKKMSSPGGHAIDALCDWLGVVMLYGGIFVHFYLHPPAKDGLLGWVPASVIVGLALFQGAVRSFSSDYYKTKYVSIFEKGTDETIDTMKRKLDALGEAPTLFQRIDVVIAKLGHLSFVYEWFDPKVHGRDTAYVAKVARRESSAAARLVALLWSISNGDAFLTLIVLSLLTNQLWFGQLFFATLGFAWMGAVLALNGWFIRSSSLSAAPRPATSARG